MEKIGAARPGMAGGNWKRAARGAVYGGKANIERRTLPRFALLCQLELRQVAKLANARAAFNVEPRRRLLSTELIALHWHTGAPPVPLMKRSRRCRLRSSVRSSRCSHFLRRLPCEGAGRFGRRHGCRRDCRAVAHGLGMEGALEAARDLVKLWNEDGRQTYLPTHTGDAPTGTFCSILKQAQVTEDEFRDL